MSRLIQAPPAGVSRDDARAVEIVTEYLDARDALGYPVDRRKTSGLEVRYRNRLVREAGYSYGDAYSAVAAAAAFLCAHRSCFGEGE